MFRRKALVLPVGLAVALALAGCSSDDQDAPTTPASASVEQGAASSQGGSEPPAESGAGSESGDQTGAAATDQGDSGAATGVEGAQAIIAEAMQRPTEITVTEPLNADIPESGTVYWVECGVPACVELGDHLEKATEALGWDLKRINGGLTPETIKNAWVQAVNANPEPLAVIGSGYPRENFESELEKLDEMGIPAINISTNDKAGGGLTASLGSGDVRNVTVGEMQAAWTIADGEGDPNTAFVYSPSFPSQVPLVQGFEDEYQRLCPDCAFERFEVSIESIGSTLPQEVTAYLQSHPDVDHLAFGFGDMVVGVPTALANAGMKDRVRIVTDTPGLTTSTYMVNGQNVFAATAYPAEEFIWQAVDVVLRYEAGQDVSVSADAPPVQWLMTPETLPSNTESFPIVVDYQEQFKKLWGIG